LQPACPTVAVNSSAASAAPNFMVNVMSNLAVCSVHFP
jgi:hypothetical protein